MVCALRACRFALTASSLCCRRSGWETREKIVRRYNRGLLFVPMHSKTKKDCFNKYMSRRNVIDLLLKHKLFNFVVVCVPIAYISDIFVVAAGIIFFCVVTIIITLCEDSSQEIACNPYAHSSFCLFLPPVCMCRHLQIIREPNKHPQMLLLYFNVN